MTTTTEGSKTQVHPTTDRPSDPSRHRDTNGLFHLSHAACKLCAIGNPGEKLHAQTLKCRHLGKCAGSFSSALQACGRSPRQQRLRTIVEVFAFTQVIYNDAEEQNKQDDVKKQNNQTNEEIDGRNHNRQAREETIGHTNTRIPDVCDKIPHTPAL